MADNVTVKDASGTTVTIASDEVSGAQIQRTKITWGADGSASDVSAAAPLPGQASQSAYAAGVTILSTGLNSLANSGNSAASAAVDNTTLRYTRADVQLYIAAQGSVRSSGAIVTLFMLTRTDGTNYDTLSETTSEPVAVFTLDASTAARYVTVRGLTLPPENMQFFARNGTGQAMAASGNTVVIRQYYGA